MRHSDFCNKNPFVGGQFPKKIADWMFVVTRNFILLGRFLCPIIYILAFIWYTQPLAYARFLQLICP